MTTHALIVDDSRLACKVLADMLEPLNFSSVSVYSAEQALEYLKKHQPEIIFLDHSMPGMNGFEAIKIIKANPQTATIPVMMYTAKQGEVYVGQARALGAVDVLPKGSEKDYLHGALKRLGFITDETLAKSLNGNAAAKVTSAEPNQVKKATPAEAVTEIRETKAESDAQAKVGAELGWREYWLQHIQPYLKRQKVQQSEELLHISKQQTRYLIRDLHKTFESFEHALVLRLESHDDFLEAKRALGKQRRRKWLILGILILVSVQSLMIWQFNRLESANQALLAAQQQDSELRKQMLEQLSQLQEQVAALEPVPQTVASAEPSISLHNLQREHRADIFPNGNSENEYRGITATGYQFYVNAQGEIGTHQGDRFFLATNCQGDPFVASPGSQVFKQSDGSLWYVDKLAEPVSVNVNSQLTVENECIPRADEALALKRLQRNVSLETGLEEQESLQLIYNRP